MYNVFFDGGKRNNGISYGYVIKDNNGKIIHEDGGFYQNNQLSSNAAEYVALINALLNVKCLGYENVSVYGDSLLIISQVNGTFKVKNDNLRQLLIMVKILTKMIGVQKFEWIPRENNKEADRQSRDK